MLVKVFIKNGRESSEWVHPMTISVWVLGRVMEGIFGIIDLLLSGNLPPAQLRGSFLPVWLDIRLHPLPELIF